MPARLQSAVHSGREHFRVGASWPRVRQPRAVALLRHISHALAAGVPLEVVQQNAGHASLDTTTRYVTTEAARRMEAMQAVWDAGKGDGSPPHILLPKIGHLSCVCGD